MTPTQQEIAQEIRGIAARLAAIQRPPLVLAKGNQEAQDAVAEWYELEISAAVADLDELAEDVDPAGWDDLDAYAGEGDRDSSDDAPS